jgi:hypothetical protein
MKLVRCRNGFLDVKNGKCGHFFAILTDSQVAALKTDPEGGPIFRCSSCPPDQRWMRIVDQGQGPVIEVISRPKEGLDELLYTEEKVFNQIG